jgi:sugar O-acyltransferase (sialic acid O-acetyltransferase NeuD family)
MVRIVVIGGGGHAKVVISLLKKSGYDIAGYTDRENRGVILGIPYLGDDSILQDLSKNYPDCVAVIGVGKIDSSQLRLALQDTIATIGFDFPAIVSPRAIVNEAVSLGAGTVVFDGVVVNSGAEIGRACIINTNSTIEHDCRLGENVHIAPGVTLSGLVTIGRNTMIGTGATVIHSVSITDGCLVGAGSTVIKDITVPGTYVGSPAKRIK